MNNILLVNPRGGLVEFGKFLNQEKVKCYVAITDIKRNFLIDGQSEYYQVFSPATLPNDLKFVSAISSDVLGFRYLESLNTDDRIYLKNSKEKSKSRLDAFLIGAPQKECLVIETFSFNGRHTLSSAWKFSNGSYVLQDPDEFPNWDELVDIAFESLENVGYVNGPSQVFVDNDNNVLGLKYQIVDCMNNRLAVDLVGRYWLSHWPAVISDSNKNDKGFFKRYYEWSRSIDNRRYNRLLPYVHQP